ncbi:MAG: DUF5103 domain-containing protein [Bacteroidota bacterium]
MPNILKHTLVAFLLAKLMILSLYAGENEVFYDEVFDEDIKTVRIHQKGWEVSYPFYELHSGNKLLLSFDDLHEYSRDFEYKVIHCDQNWRKSNLFFSDYVDGFESNPVREREMSVNTFIPYDHYTLEIPNEDVRFRESGNYVVMVYQASEPDNPLFIKRFMVVEHDVKVNAEVRQPVMSLYRSIGHDIKFSLETNSMEFNNVFEDLDVVIVQNHQWEGAKSGFDPDFINNDEIVFHRDDQAVFKASNEYRRFSTRDLKYTDDEVAAINYDKPNYFITLATDPDLRFKQYLDRDDFNGRYMISNREGWEALTDADYTWVKFRLPARSNLMPDEVHVYGELTQWRCDEHSQMTFNPKTRMYETELFLKQGVYTYRYVLKEKGGEINHMRFEGSHWETENDYMIIVYYHDRRLGADRIIGFDLVNSRQNTEGRE